MRPANGSPTWPSESTECCSSHRRAERIARLPFCDVCPPLPSTDQWSLWCRSTRGVPRRKRTQSAPRPASFRVGDPAASVRTSHHFPRRQHASPRSRSTGPVGWQHQRRQVVTEYVYDLVRQTVAPHAPSRLNAVFAFVDEYEAFSFLAVSNEELIGAVELATRVSGRLAAARLRREVAANGDAVLSERRRRHERTSVRCRDTIVQRMKDSSP